MTTKTPFADMKKNVKATTAASKNAQAASQVLGQIAESAGPMVPAITLEPSRPSADWTLEELGAFASKSYKKSAESIWEFGRALFLAKKKLAKKGQWMQWRETHLPNISQSTVNRAMLVGALDFEDIKGKTASEVYGLFGKATTTKKTITIGTPSSRAARHINALTTLLDSDQDIVDSNRELFVALNEKITKLLIGARTIPPKG